MSVIISEGILKVLLTPIWLSGIFSVFIILLPPIYIYLIIIISIKYIIIIYHKQNKINNIFRKIGLYVEKIYNNIVQEFYDMKILKNA